MNRAPLDPHGILGLTDDLCRHRVGVAAPGNGALFDRVAEELPIRLHAFASGESHNGWRVPDEWAVEEATIWCGDRLIDDAGGHPLGVASQSRGFEGELSLDELRRHLVSDPERPNARIFHCRWQYRPWDADWALSLPDRVVRGLEDARYRVRLRVRSEPGEMLVADHEHTGRTGETIVFNSHTCHPGQANDGMVGVATLIRLFQWLEGRETRLTYRLVLGPEHLGTVFYLRDMPAAEMARLAGGVFVEMTGVDAPLIATSTFDGETPVDRALAHVLRHGAPDARRVAWREGAGNDETVWEAPGYEVPFAELTRRIDTFDPYPQYHSDLDTPQSLDGERVDEAFEVLQDMVDVLEGDVVAHRRFEGLVCLSAPEYDLYPERPDPSLGDAQGDLDERWGRLVDRILRWCDGRTSALEMADAVGLPFAEVRAYLERFEDAGLVDLTAVSYARMPPHPPLAAPSARVQEG